MKKRERFDIDGIAYELVVNLHDMQEGEDDVYGITDSRHKYVLVTNENKYLGGVLYINSDLRDGIAMLVVDDCGHTSFIDRKTKVSDVINTKADNKNVFIAVHSESYASSKYCSVCGHKHNELKLSDREWTCGNCGTHLDRDVNAAKNLQYYALWLMDKHLDANPTTVSSTGSYACGDERLQFCEEQCSSMKQEFKTMHSFA